MMRIGKQGWKFWRGFKGEFVITFHLRSFPEFRALVLNLSHDYVASHALTHERTAQTSGKV